jgi:Lsr2
LGGGVGPVAGRVVFDHGSQAMEHRSNDLSQANVDKFAAAITPYVAGQRVGSRRTSSTAKASSSGPGEVDTKAVRKWASSNGIELLSRGRVPAEVIEKYRAAGN